MTIDAYVALGIFFLAQIIAFVGIVFSMKGDTKILRMQMTDVRDELKQLNQVVIDLARQQTAIVSIDDRVVLTGKRLDEVSRRLNSFIDAIALNANARALVFPEVNP
jgi:hypothetical protein